MARGRDGAQRWKGLPLQAGLVRSAAFVLPVAASVAVAAAVSRLLSPAPDLGGLAVRALAVLIPATLTLLTVERLARRFLPLATLLRLSLVFPDRAPSRYAVARLVNSTRELQHRVEAARAGTIPEEPGEAARTILALVAALSEHDRRTRGHSERVRIYTDLLAEEMGLAVEIRDRLRWAALVHDIGKLHVPERVLNKAGRPTDDEWEVLRRHPEEGARLCGSLVPWLGEAGRAIVEHHERFDGSGYPAGLVGDEITTAGRILAVADAFEVMTAARAYKRPMNAAAAREELARCAGTQFDPAVVRAFLSISLGRLRVAMGPVSWLAQWPFLSQLPQFGQTAGQAGAALSGAATLGAAGMLGPAGLPGTPPAPTEEALAGEFTREDAVPAAGDDDPDAAGTPATPPATSGLAPATNGLTPPPRSQPSDSGTEGPDEPPAGTEPAADTRPAPEPAARPGPTSPEPSREDTLPPEPTREPQPAPTPVPPPTPTATEAPRPDGGSEDPDDPLDDTVDALDDTLDDTVEDLDDTVDNTVDTLDDTVDTLDDTLDDTVDTLDDTVDDTVEDLEDVIDDTGGIIGGLLGRRL